MRPVKASLVVLASACSMAAPPGTTAEIKAAGALDIQLSGEAAFDVEFRENDIGDDGREVFFSQDREIRLIAEGVHDTSGIRYGANLELDLGAGSNATWDEAWIFVRSGIGELRVGNEESVVELLSIGGHINNAGTGGLDGDQRTGRTDRVADSGEATKLLYFGPVIAGLRFAVS